MQMSPNMSHPPLESTPAAVGGLLWSPSQGCEGIGFIDHNCSCNRRHYCASCLNPCVLAPATHFASPCLLPPTTVLRGMETLHTWRASQALAALNVKQAPPSPCKPMSELLQHSSCMSAPTDGNVQMSSRMQPQRVGKPRVCCEGRSLTGCGSRSLFLVIARSRQASPGAVI